MHERTILSEAIFLIATYFSVWELTTWPKWAIIPITTPPSVFLIFWVRKPALRTTETISIQPKSTSWFLAAKLWWVLIILSWPVIWMSPCVRWWPTVLILFAVVKSMMTFHMLYQVDFVVCHHLTYITSNFVTHMFCIQMAQ